MQKMETKISRDIFRAYDIRGVYGESLTEEVAFLIGRALGSEAHARGIHQIITGRDGRLSGPALIKNLQAGLRASGCDVIDVGMVPTPVLYFATKVLTTNSGVMLTGSHNPGNYNGMKIVLGGDTLAESDIDNLYQRIIQGKFHEGQGNYSEVEILSQYLNRIVSDVELKRPLKVVIDCGNGIAGIIAPKLLRELGCEVIELFCDVDGTFPNHHPDPTQLENLDAIIAEVLTRKADVGIAYDGDADRLGVVTNRGQVIWADRQMMLYAKSALKNNPNGKIIFDVKCTRYLPEKIKEFGGQPLMWKTGHSLIKSKMMTEKALLAGEMSGHIFFNDRWYGFDDAIYTSARLLEILSEDTRDCATLFAELPDSINTPELKLTMADDRKFKFMSDFSENISFDGGNVSTIDGIRVDFKDGWGLVRSSNTTPCLVLRFEADDEKAMKRIQNEFRQQLLALDANLNLPF